MTETTPLAPRVLMKAQAAAYCSLTESGFEHWVRTRKLPGPLKGTRRWDKVAIDLALDRLSGIDRSKPNVETPEGALARFRVEQAARDAARAAHQAETRPSRSGAGQIESTTNLKCRAHAVRTGTAWPRVTHMPLRA